MSIMINGYYEILFCFISLVLCVSARVGLDSGAIIANSARTICIRQTKLKNATVHTASTPMRGRNSCSIHNTHSPIYIWIHFKQQCRFLRVLFGQPKSDVCGAGNLPKYLRLRSYELTIQNSAVLNKNKFVRIATIWWKMNECSVIFHTHEDWMLWNETMGILQNDAAFHGGRYGMA